MKDEVRTTLEKMFLRHYEEWCLLSFGYLQNMKKAEDVVQDVSANQTLY